MTEEKIELTLLEEARNQREAFLSLLPPSLAEWLLVEEEKRPKLLGLRRSVEYQSTCPEAINVGLHPKESLFIIDFDCNKKKLTPEMQMKALEERGFDFTDAIKVRTPSGGMHVYLQWPTEVPFPGNRPLSNIGRELTPPLELEGDLRFSNVRGHVVAPGSILKGKLYHLEEGSSLPLQSVASAQLFLPKTDRGTSSSGFSTPHSDQREAGHLPTLPLAKEKISQKLIDSLRVLLLKSRKRTWHEKRAETFVAISCCHSPQQMVFLWKELDIARDTYRGDIFPDDALYRDYRTLKEKYSGFTPGTHSKLCQHTTARKEKEIAARKERWLQEHEVDDSLEGYLSHLKKKSSWRVETVISLKKVSEAILTPRTPAKNYANAMLLTEDILQGWSNYGKEQILLSDDFLRRFYGWTASEAAAVKGLLLRRGVIFVSKKQREGKTAAFGIASSFKEDRLGRLLYATRRDLGVEQLFVDLRQGGFVDPATGECVLKLKPSTTDLLLPENGLPARSKLKKPAVLWEYLHES